MNITHDPLFIDIHSRSYALDDWRASIVLAVLENAIHELLGYRSPDKLVRSAEDYFYKDNEMFDIAMAILGYDKDKFRMRIAEMKMKGQRLRRSSDGSGGLRG